MMTPAWNHQQHAKDNMFDVSWWRPSGCGIINAEPWSREIMHTPFMEYTETTHLRHVSKEYGIIMLKYLELHLRASAFGPWSLPGDALETIMGGRALETQTHIFPRPSIRSIFVTDVRTFVSTCLYIFWTSLSFYLCAPHGALCCHKSLPFAARNHFLRSIPPLRVRGFPMEGQWPWWSSTVFCGLQRSFTAFYGRSYGYFPVFYGLFMIMLRSFTVFLRTCYGICTVLLRPFYDHLRQYAIVF